MSGQRIQSYREFWPFYVSQHCNRVCRNLHFVGTSLVIVALILGVVRSPWFFLAAPFCGYFFAWIGHFVFEKNRPATFQYPIFTCTPTSSPERWAAKSAATALLAGRSGGSRVLGLHSEKVHSRMHKCVKRDRGRYQEPKIFEMDEKGRTSDRSQNERNDRA
jgi:hypothetical protein